MFGCIGIQQYSIDLHHKDHRQEFLDDRKWVWFQDIIHRFPITAPMQGQRKVVLHHRLLTGCRIKMGIDQNNLPDLVAGKVINELRGQLHSLLIGRFISHMLVVPTQGQPFFYYSLSHFTADCIHIYLIVRISKFPQTGQNLTKFLYDIGIESSAKRGIRRKGYNCNPLYMILVRQGVRRDILQFERGI